MHSTSWLGEGGIEPPNKFSKNGEGFLGFQFLHRGSQKNNVGKLPKMGGLEQFTDLREGLVKGGQRGRG